MPLELVDKTIFSVIRQQWGAQCQEFGEEIDTFAVISMEHAQKIVENGSGDQDYSIFSALMEGNHECILHVNRAKLPKTEGITQRVMWVLLAPKYDYGTVNPNDIAKIASEVVLGAIDLCKKEHSAHIKIHIGNLADREFFAGVANALRSFGTLKDVEIRGNWLHISIE
jgi:hypothetical protein